MSRRALAVPLITFVVVLGVLALLQRGDEGSAATRPLATPALAPGASTAERHRALEAGAREAPAGRRPWVALAAAYQQRGRETADPTFDARAERVLRRALRERPDDAEALTGLGQVAMSRHAFGTALGLARRARRLQPDADHPFPVLVDALIELGRYDEARRELQTFVSRRPGMPSYSRVAYLRELHGDVAGAVEAMRLAASAGGSPQSIAFSLSDLGRLELGRGRLAEGRRALRAALAAVPGHAAAEAAMAQADLAVGRMRPAIRRLQALTRRLPLPEHLLVLAEAQRAAGQDVDAERTLDRVRAEQRTLRSQGTDTDAEMAEFEADFGEPQRAVALGRRAWRKAPSVVSADAIGWALSRAGRPAEGLRYLRRAVARGWGDPHLLFHAGMTAYEAGSRREARRLLRRALATPLLAPIDRPPARAALRDLARS